MEASARRGEEKRRSSSPSSPRGPVRDVQNEGEKDLWMRGGKLCKGAF